MPVQESHLPKLCRHKAKNRAFVRLNGEAIYCGPWGSADARERYEALIRQWLGNGRRLPAVDFTAPLPPEAYTIDALCADYLVFAQQHYVKNGQQTDEVACLQSVIRVWVKAYIAEAIAVGKGGPEGRAQDDGV